MRWRTWLVIAVVLFGGWRLLQHAGAPETSAEQLEQLATTVSAGDVLIYTTTDDSVELGIAGEC